MLVSDDGYCEDEKEFEVNFHLPPDAGEDKQFEFCNTDNQVDLYTLLDATTPPDGQWYKVDNSLIPNGLLTIQNAIGVNEINYVLDADFCPADTAIYFIDVKKYENAGNDFDLHLCNENQISLSQHLTTTAAGHWVSVDGFDNTRFDENTGVFNLTGLEKDSYFFQYVITNDAPCVNDTAFAEIKVSEMPNVVFSSDVSEGCSPLTVVFKDDTEVNGQRKHEWYVEGSLQGQEQEFSHLFENVHCYDIGLKMTVDNLCVSETNISNMICVNPDPIADFAYNPTDIFSDNPFVEFQNNSWLNYQNHWTFGTVGGSTEVNPYVDFPEGVATEYPVKLVVVSDKGCVDSITKVIPVRDQTLFYVPNAFTPNGDEFNTVFKPVMTVGVDYREYVLKIYNRWGELVFESHDAEVGWDGTFFGKSAPDGVYVWEIKFREIFTSNSIISRGFVNLLR